MVQQIAFFILAHTADIGDSRADEVMESRLHGPTDGQHEEQAPLGTTLLLKWGWGAMSAADTQEVAHHASLSGCDQAPCISPS